MGLIKYIVMSGIKTISRSFPRAHKPGSKEFVQIDHYFFSVEHKADSARNAVECAKWLSERFEPFHYTIFFREVLFKTYDDAFEFQMRWG